MKDTQIKQRESFYQRLMNEDLEAAKAGDAYKNIIASLGELLQMNDKIGTEAMNEDSLKRMINLYHQITSSCDQHMENAESGFDKSRNSIVKELKRILDKDLQVLNRMERNKLTSYRDAVKMARIPKLNVDLKGNEFKTVGGAVSSRIPIRFYKGNKGYFTKKSFFEQEEDWKKAIDKNLKLFPEKCHSNLQKLITDQSFRMEFAEAIATDPSKPKVGSAGMLLGLDYDDCYDNEILFKFVEEMVNMCNTLLITKEGAGIKEGRRLDHRNAAMSTIARAIGCPKLIANAVPAEMIIGDKKYEGTFMEEAKGDDINNLKYDSGLMQMDDNSFHTPELYEQLGNLQALDYICGNVDRHPGNMLYQFDGGKPSKLLGIQGIDNDLSFGTKSFNEVKDLEMRLVHPEQMGLLSVKTATAISGLTEEVLKTMLMEYDFTKEELDAAWKRTQNLQEAIKNKKITLVKPNEWDKAVEEHKHKLNKHSLFSVVENRLNKKRKNIILGSPRNYENASDDQLYTEIRSRGVDLQEKIAVIRKLDRHFGSREFDAMRDGLYKLNKEYKALEDKLANKNRPTEYELKNIEDLQDALAESTQKYINAKKLMPTTERGRLRLETAKALQDIVLDSRAFQLQVLEEQRKESENSNKEEMSEEIDNGFEV